MSNKLMRDE